jgi:DNA-binding transcriptional MerR regulator
VRSWRSSRALILAEQRDPNTNALPIGALAERTGCNVPTIRYYEEIGLLPRAARKASGHRVYSDADMRRLLLIRRCRDFGFAIEQVRALVGLMDEGSRDCMEARDLAQEHLGTVREKIREMKALECSIGV